MGQANSETLAQDDQAKVDQYEHRVAQQPLPHATTESGLQRYWHPHRDALHRSEVPHPARGTAECSNDSQVDLVVTRLHLKSTQHVDPLLQSLPSTHHRSHNRPMQQQEFDLRDAKFHWDDPYDDAMQHAHSEGLHCTIQVVMNPQGVNQDQLSLPNAMHEYRAVHPFPL